jgi:hypothetical protein
LITLPAKLKARINEHVLLLSILLPAVPAAAAPDVRLWGTLVPGPYAVGFMRSWELDPARQYAPEYRGDRLDFRPVPQCPRPILVSLWYPARKSDRPPMHYREYLDFSSDNPLIAPFAKRLEAFTRRTAPLGDAGYGLFIAGRRSEGLVLMRERCELFPNSWQAQMFLAERLLDNDDLAGALAGYRKAEELIASGAMPPASERVRKMIANALKRAGEK